MVCTGVTVAPTFAVTNVVATDMGGGKIKVDVTTNGTGQYAIKIDGAIVWQGSYGSQSITFSGLSAGSHTVCAE